MLFITGWIQVSRFSEEKGHLYFVEAAAKLVKSYENVEFIYVGDGPLRYIIEQKAKECGVDSYSQFLGFRSDVGELLQTLDVLVLSSLWEGLPISLLEAQYFGVASVVTNVGGIAEIISNGYNGLLVPPRDADALASAVINLLKNDVIRDKMGQYAKRLFAEKFSSEIMADAYINNINNILSGKKSKKYLVK